MQFFPMNMAARSANVRLDDLFVPSGTSGDVDFSALLSSHFDQRFSNTTSFTGSNAQQSAAPPPPTPERNPEPSLVQSPPPSSRSDDSRSADTGAPTSQVAPVDQNAPRPAEQSARAEELAATDEEKSAGVGATEEQGTEDSAQELSTDDHAHAESAATDQPPVTGQGHEAAHASSAAHADSEAQHGHDAATADESLEASADGPADAEDTSWTELTQRVETMLSALAELLATLDAETPELQTLKEQVAEKLELVRAKVRQKGDFSSQHPHEASESIAGEFRQIRDAVKTILNSMESVSGQGGASRGHLASVTELMRKVEAVETDLVHYAEKHALRAASVKAVNAVDSRASTPLYADVSKQASSASAALTENVGLDNNMSLHDQQAETDKAKLHSGSVQSGTSEHKSESFARATAHEAPLHEELHRDETASTSSHTDVLSPSQSGTKAKSDSGEMGKEPKQRDARNGFFEFTSSDKATSSRPSASGQVGVDVHSTQSFAQTNAQDLANRNMQPSTKMMKNQEVYKQVENGVFKDLGQGTKQLVIRLDPADLGQVSVVLQVKGKEVQAVLRTTTAEASQALNEQMTQLKTQLESQGLKVTKLEVQTQLSDSQTNTQWQGAEQHNRQHENRELAMTAQRFRSLGRGDVGLAQDVQKVPYTEKNSLSGVDIFA